MRQVIAIVAIGALIGAAHHAAGETFLSTTSADGDTGPQKVTWTQPTAVDACAFPSVGSVGLRATTQYLDVNSDPEGDMPRDLAFTADGSAAVIANRDTDCVTFFDVATRTITHTVTVGDFPVHVAVTPDNQYVVVPNVFTNNVSVIDIATHTVAATVPITGEQPYRVAITPDSQYAVVGVINDAVSSSFSVIDLNTLTEVRTFASTPQGVFGWFFTPESGIFGNIFTQFALSPDGTKIVLPDRGNAQVAIYDFATGGQTLLATASGPTAVDISSDSTLAVVSHETSPGAISTIDLTTLSVTNSFSTGDALSDQIIRVTPNKSHAIAAIMNNTIFTDLSTGARTATLYTGSVGDIEISYDGQYAFVSNYNARVISIASQSIVKTITFAACTNAATSPVELRAVALNNRFREDIHLYDINGAAGYLEGYALSGEPPEGDAPRNIGLSPDGTVAVVCNNTSRNVVIIDTLTPAVRSYVDVGDRPYAAAITPDGAYAVVCAADENYVRIIDLSTDTIVQSLYVYRRPMAVRISPDGQYAYVLNVASGDKVTFIHLDGASSSIITQVAAGETGSVGTFLSGVELSHDGSVFAVCASFDDRLNLFDTATYTQVASVPVGDFPLRVAFSPDDTRAYVTNVFSDNVSVVAVAGASSYLIGNYGSLDYPVTVSVDAANAYVYFGNISASAGIHVFDTATSTFVQSVLMADGDPYDAYLSWTDDTLYVAASNAEVLRIAATGPTSALIDATPLSSDPVEMAFYNTLGLAVIPQRVPDGVDIVQFGCVGDLNGDRVIDLSDLGILLAHYGTTGGATYEDGDLTRDGNVNLSDLGILLAFYGTTCP